MCYGSYPTTSGETEKERGPIRQGNVFLERPGKNKLEQIAKDRDALDLEPICW